MVDHKSLAASSPADRFLPMKVLCLHDARSSANELRESLDRLGTRLFERHKIDLVYVNAPLDGGLWFEDPNYLGMDASLLLLQQVWNSTPMQGILGVGQGAHMVSLLAPLIDPLFCIFLREASLQPILETRDTIFDGPSLHIVDEMSDDLWLRQYGGSMQVATSATERDNLLGRFLVQHKATTVSNLQLAVAQTEQQIHALLVKELRTKMPHALLAVVAPEAVAGRTQRVVQPEGGGAPCPSTKN